MRTTKGIPWRMGLWGIVAGAILVLLAPGAHAITGTCTNETDCVVGTDRAASFVIFPRIEVDTDEGVDTIIQLTNAGERRTIDVRCFFVNGNGHCSSSGDPCDPNNPARDDCSDGETCLPPACGGTDFRMTLTKRQPISWRASQQELSFLPCDPSSPDASSCTKDDQGAPIFNAGGTLGVPEDPFLGELKCVQVDESDQPVDFNELKGEATVIRTQPSGDGAPFVDVAKYNAIGVQAIPTRQDGNPNRLCVGGNDPTDSCENGAEYAGCPQTLIMDNFFDNDDDGNVESNLTLVPCAENIETPDPTRRTTIQFLVFNEYEQRFSTSFRMGCYDRRNLSDIDTRIGESDDAASIFSINVQGTTTGQTRIRAVGTNSEARGVLGLVEEKRGCEANPTGSCSAMVNLHHQGRRNLGDLVELPE